jgi:hypothetical protein
MNAGPSRQLHFNAVLMSSGHHQSAWRLPESNPCAAEFTGTPEQAADTIEDWFGRGAADGFNVMPAAVPSGLQTFADHVIPIFRRRGLFRTEYTSQALREHYGLPRPGSQFTANRRGVPEPVA